MPSPGEFYKLWNESFRRLLTGFGVYDPWMLTHGVDRDKADTIEVSGCAVEGGKRFLVLATVHEQSNPESVLIDACTALEKRIANEGREISWDEWKRTVWINWKEPA